MKKLLIFAAAFFISVFVYVCDAADTTAKETLFEQTKKSAEAGNAESQYELAKMYYYKGQAVVKQEDYAEAFKWYKKAANQGSVNAQNMLGEIYFFKRYYDEAAVWFRKAAEQGYANAQYMLSIILQTKDFNEAIKWCRKAAEQEKEHGYANSLLDKFLSFEQTKKAAEAGNAESQYKLAQIYGSAYYDPQDDRIYNYEIAEKWYKKAAEQGHAGAQDSLGNIYFYGFNDPIKGRQDYTGKPDYAEAVKWFKKAEENGYNYAGTEYKLGDLYYYGDKEGVEQDFAEAMKWYMKALDNGIENVDNFEYGHLPLQADVLHKIGTMYYYGLGVEKNIEEAEKLFQKAFGRQKALETLDKIKQIYKADTSTDNKLFEAVQKGDAETVSNLLKSGVNANMQDKNGCTVLIYASQYGQKEIVKILLKTAKTDPNVEDSYGYTSLMLASLYGQKETVEILLKANTNPNLRNQYGGTALTLAVEKGYTEIADMLKKAGAK